MVAKRVITHFRFSVLSPHSFHVSITASVCYSGVCLIKRVITAAELVSGADSSVVLYPMVLVRKSVKVELLYKIMCLCDLGDFLPTVTTLTPNASYCSDVNTVREFVNINASVCNILKCSKVVAFVQEYLLHVFSSLAIEN